MIPKFAVSLALALCGVGLLRFDSPALRKLGLVSFWLASGVGAWALTGAWWAGAAALFLWIAFPLSEMFVVLLRLEIPRERRLRQASPPLDEFPGLRELTARVEELGFRQAEDCRLTPPVQDQFYRLFIGEGGFHHALIGFVSEGGFGFDFVAFSSQDGKAGLGRQWVTWDYPLSYGLKTPPQLVIHRAAGCDTPAELFEEHRELLRLNSVSDADLLPAPAPDAARERLEETLARQLLYNLSIGILRPGVEDGLRYSWRGAFYVATQAVRDMVRL